MFRHSQNTKKKYQKYPYNYCTKAYKQSNEIKKLCDEHNLNSQILNNDQKIQGDKEIIIVNAFGVLSKFFKNTKSVFMGKSLFKNS